jgi:group I intron endonuclease
MPKVTNYQNGKIYKLVNNMTNDIYVGSTCSLLCERIAQHRIDSKKEKKKNILLYKFIFDNGGWANFTIVLIELYNCNSKIELFQRERYWYDQLKPSLNAKKPYTTNNEKQEYQIKYRRENNIIINLKEKIKYHRVCFQKKQFKRTQIWNNLKLQL